MSTTHINCDQSGLSDAEALDAAAGRLQLEVIEEILDGGSPARVYLTRACGGEQLVVKILIAREGVVDGHDLGSFRHKLRQIEAIRATAPHLGARYLPIVHSLDGVDWAGYTTPYFPSRDLAAPLRDRGGEEVFFRQYTAVAEDLFVRGYGVAAVPAPPDYLERVVVGRFLRRLPVLERALPEALGADEVVVNGRLCLAPRLLLPRLLDEARRHLELMAPPRLMFCAHGDANTRNILVAPTADAVPDCRVIDPRGSSDYWDPVYDLAKTLFSLSVWDPALRLGFAIRTCGGPGRPAYEVGFRQPLYPGYRAAMRRFLPYLASLPGLVELFGDDRGWQARLLLTHDQHVLAEAPCRLSDRKPKWGCDGAPSSPEDLALGHYLLGTLLINELAEQLTGRGELDVGRHLSLVAGGDAAE